MSIWDDIIIGDCEKSGSSTIIPSQRSGSYAPAKGTLTCKSRISVSGQSYWITTDFLDMGMRIAKKSNEGFHLSAMLDNENWDGIDDMLALLVIAHATPEIIRVKMAEAVREAYKNGSEDRAALGVARDW